MNRPVQGKLQTSTVKGAENVFSEHLRVELRNLSAYHTAFLVAILCYRFVGDWQKPTLMMLVVVYSAPGVGTPMLRLELIDRSN